MQQNNLMLLEQLLGMSGSVWLPVAMLVGLLLALIFRPNTIHNLTLFRAACWLLGLSLIAPTAINLLLTAASVNSYGGSPYGLAGNTPPFLYACANAIGPMLQGACILAGLFSLIPPVVPRHSMADPLKHPLE
jgi:hypothetical protein